MFNGAIPLSAGGILDGGGGSGGGIGAVLIREFPQFRPLSDWTLTPALPLCDDWDVAVSLPLDHELNGFNPLTPFIPFNGFGPFPQSVFGFESMS